MKRWIYLLALVVLPYLVNAQCAMCKAVVESNATDAENVVEGVNNGILYLMGIPYLMLFVVGFAWYKKYGKSMNQ